MTWSWTADTSAALARFLADHELCSGELQVRRIGDGLSNLTYLVDDGVRQVVVRRPPPPPVPAGAHDVLREARVLAALRGTSVPVPDVLATAEAGEVLDVPLYVMTFAAGPVVTTTTPAALSAAIARRDVGYALVDVLAELHAVDWQGVGLGDLGRPEGFNRRHLRRIGRLIGDADGAPPAHFAAIDSWLGASVPEESGAALVHNDYRLGNVVLGPGSPARVAAVLDWELATIGDPLFDVGYFLASVPEPGAARTPTQDLAAAMLEHGYPTREQLAQRYAERTGRDLASLRWYSVLALWKLAVLYEYGRRRAVLGVGDPYYGDPELVQRFLAAAHRTAGLAAPPPGPLAVPAAGRPEEP